MKKNQKNHRKGDGVCFIIIMIVALIDVLYGVVFQINKYEYQKNTKEVIANIHQITKNKKTNTLYIDYSVNKKQYNGVIATTNKSITINNNLRIYYKENNPKEFTDGTISKAGYYIIAIGILAIMIDFKFFVLKKKHK